jgi:hypothetical protein
MGKSPRYILVTRLGGPHSWSGRRGEEKILDPTGTRNSDPAVFQPVVIRYTTTVSRLLKCIYKFIIFLLYIFLVYYFNIILKTGKADFSPVLHSRSILFLIL